MNTFQLLKMPSLHFRTLPSNIKDVRPFITQLFATSSVINKLFSTEVLQQQNDPDKLYKVVELELKGNDPAVLKSYSKFAVTTGNHLEIKSTSWSSRKPHHERHTVLKSVHIYKKHRVQYEIRTYFSFVQYKELTGSTADTLLEYIQRNLPEGVSMKATKVELQTLPSFISEESS